MAFVVNLENGNKRLCGRDLILGITMACKLTDQEVINCSNNGVTFIDFENLSERDKRDIATIVAATP